MSKTRLRAYIKFSLRSFSCHFIILIIILWLMTFCSCPILCILHLRLLTFYFILSIILYLLSIINFYILSILLKNITYVRVSRLFFLIRSILKTFYLYTMTLFHLRIFISLLIIFPFCSFFNFFSIIFITTMTNIHIYNLHFLTMRSQIRNLSRSIHISIGFFLFLLFMSKRFILLIQSLHIIYIILIIILLRRHCTLNFDIIIFMILKVISSSVIKLIIIWTCSWLSLELNKVINILRLRMMFKIKFKILFVNCWFFNMSLKVRYNFNMFTT